MNIIGVYNGVIIIIIIIIIIVTGNVYLMIFSFSRVFQTIRNLDTREQKYIFVVRFLLFLLYVVVVVVSYTITCKQSNLCGLFH